MRALNVVHCMIYTKEDLHHKVYSETKSGLKVPTQNRTNNSPNGHFAQQCLCPSGYAVDGNRNNDRQLAWLSGRVDVDGNRNGSESEPAWRAQTACFGAFDGSAPCVAHQEDRRYADDRW